MKSKVVEIDGKAVTICWNEKEIIDVNVKPSVVIDGDVPPFVARDLTKPTMAEIERLVDVLVDSSRSDGYVGLEADYHLAARAALIAAIRAAIK